MFFKALVFYAMLSVSPVLASVSCDGIILTDEAGVVTGLRTRTLASYSIDGAELSRQVVEYFGFRSEGRLDLNRAIAGFTGLFTLEFSVKRLRDYAARVASGDVVVPTLAGCLAHGEMSVMLGTYLHAQVGVFDITYIHNLPEAWQGQIPTVGDESTVPVHWAALGEEFCRYPETATAERQALYLQSLQRAIDAVLESHCACLHGVRVPITQ